jgi:uncharacterized cupin superfamily protein
MFNYKVTQHGLELHPSKYTFDENNKVFSSLENDLVLDFSTVDGFTFKTGSDCTFKTGSDCTFTTIHDCTFITGSSCTFKTGSYCTFKTGNYCTFNTGFNCTFKTGSDCTFKTGSSCTFDTGYNCTFDTNYACTFKTGSACTFKTGSQCVIVRRDIFQIIQPLVDEIITLCPYDVQGFLADGYLNRDQSLGKYIIVDGILSPISVENDNVYYKNRT